MLTRMALIAMIACVEVEKDATPTASTGLGPPPNPVTCGSASLGYQTDALLRWDQTSATYLWMGVEVTCPRPDIDMMMTKCEDGIICTGN